MGARAGLGHLRSILTGSLCAEQRVQHPFQKSSWYAQLCEAGVGNTRPAVPLLSKVLRIRGHLRVFSVTPLNGHSVLNVLGKYLASHIAEVSA